MLFDNDLGLWSVGELCTLLMLTIIYMTAVTLKIELLILKVTTWFSYLKASKFSSLISNMVGKNWECGKLHVIFFFLRPNKNKNRNKTEKKKFPVAWMWIAFWLPFACSCFCFCCCCCCCCFDMCIKTLKWARKTKLAEKSYKMIFGLNLCCRHQFCLFGKSNIWVCFWLMCKIDMKKDSPPIPMALFLCLSDKKIPHCCFSVDKMKKFKKCIVHSSFWMSYWKDTCCFVLFLFLFVCLFVCFFFFT